MKKKRDHRNFGRISRGKNDISFHLCESKITPSTTSTPNSTINSKVSDLVDKFAQFTIRHRIHLGQWGSTRAGWTAKTLFKWKHKLQDLSSQLEGTRTIREVMEWYMHHWEEEYVPQCRTILSFCEKFAQLQDAMRRSNKPPRSPGGSMNGRYEEDRMTDEERKEEEEYNKLIRKNAKMAHEDFERCRAKRLGMTLKDYKAKQKELEDLDIPDWAKD